MKAIRIATLITCLFSFASVEAAETIDPTLIRLDLERVVGRVLDPSRFSILVSIEQTQVKSRELIEGEDRSTAVVSKSLPESEAPLLPGFLPKVNPPPAPQKPEERTRREVYRDVMRTEVKQVKVYATFDQALSETERASGEKVLREAIQAAVTVPSKIEISTAALRKEEALQSADFWWKGAAAGLALLLLILLAAYLASRRKRADESSTASSARDAWPFREATSVPATPVESSGPRRALPMGRALPPGHTGANFPALPASVGFAEKRLKLLQTLLQDANCVGDYLLKLQEASQQELYALLRGPAYDSLLETLKISPPKGAEHLPVPAEEQIDFYQKNFEEFLQARSWQINQYFGFMRTLTLDQQIVLLGGENPLVIAVTLRFMPPEQAALLLDRLSSDLRARVIQSFPRAAEFPTSEFLAIEERLRGLASRLPGGMHGYSESEVRFWVDLLAQSRDEKRLLQEIQASRPELFSALLPFQFDLNEIQRVPSGARLQVLENLDNEVLAQALVGESQEVCGQVLADLPEPRKRLIEELVALQGLEKTDSQAQARSRLVRSLRERLV